MAMEMKGLGPVTSEPRQNRSAISDKYGPTSKLLSQALYDFEKSRKFMVPYFQKWLRYYKLYRNYSTPRTRPWRANIMIPTPFTSVEHGTALLMDPWNQRPAIQVYPRGNKKYDAA